MQWVYWLLFQRIRCEHLQYCALHREHSERGKAGWYLLSWRSHCHRTVWSSEHSWLHYSLWMSRYSHSVLWFASKGHIIPCRGQKNRLHRVQWFAPNYTLWKMAAPALHSAFQWLIWAQTLPFPPHFLHGLERSFFNKKTSGPYSFLSPCPSSKLHKYWRHILRI